MSTPQKPWSGSGPSWKAPERSVRLRPQSLTLVFHDEVQVFWEGYAQACTYLRRRRCCPWIVADRNWRCERGGRARGRRVRRLRLCLRLSVLGDRSSGRDREMRRLLQKSRHHRQGLRCVGGRWPQALRAERLRQRASPWRRAEHRVEALLQTPSLDRHQPFLPSQIQAPITQSLPPSSRLISQYFQAAAQESGPPLAAGMLMP